MVDMLQWNKPLSSNGDKTRCNFPRKSLTHVGHGSQQYSRAADTYSEVKNISIDLHHKAPDSESDVDRTELVSERPQSESSS